ncbi:MAG TPA: hypothetical protein VFY14_12410, partial [Streptomyces sp.]|nr:hypothetical protein [Streptomyces sp.]
MTTHLNDTRPRERNHRADGPRFLSAEEAVALVRSRDTLVVGGSGGGLLEPDLLLSQLGLRYEATRQPRDLTLVHTTGIGDRKGGG